MVMQMQSAVGRGFCPATDAFRTRLFWVALPVHRQRHHFMLPADYWRPLRTRACTGATARWNLDDVERISRGRPSKSKLGSRAVPHRLNAEERKAFELAKKRGYVVQQANGRRYPLVNTHRNYCDAIGMPCIRIELGTGEVADHVVIDFSPLHLPEPAQLNLREEVIKAITALSSSSDEQTERQDQVTERVSGGCEEGSHREELSPRGTRPQDEFSEQFQELDDGAELLRFRAPSRKMSRMFGQAALDAWNRVLDGRGRAFEGVKS